MWVQQLHLLSASVNGSSGRRPECIAAAEAVCSGLTCLLFGRSPFLPRCFQQGVLHLCGGDWDDAELQPMLFNCWFIRVVAD